MGLRLSRCEDYVPIWAPLLIRLALGIIFVLHGAQKVFGMFGGPGIAGVTHMITGMGLKPVPLWVWALSLTEFVGGIAVLVGLLTRLASFALAVTMIVAIVAVTGRYGFMLPRGFEYNFALLFMAMSLIASGAGRISLDWLFSVLWNHRQP